jgi:hypothetical protein
MVVKFLDNPRYLERLVLLILTLSPVLIVLGLVVAIYIGGH